MLNFVLLPKAGVNNKKIIMWELIYLSMQDIISAIKRIQNGNLYSNQQQRSQYQQLLYVGPNILRDEFKCLGHNFEVFLDQLLMTQGQNFWNWYRTDKYYDFQGKNLSIILSPIVWTVPCLISNKEPSSVNFLIPD